MNIEEAIKIREVPANDLRWRCPGSIFSFRTTKEIEPCNHIIGQKRALNALKLGIEIYNAGYNIFVCGVPGTGRKTLVKAILNEIAPHTTPALDRCYVNNFQNPACPILLSLPRGKGRYFMDDMDRLISLLQKEAHKYIQDKQTDIRSRITPLLEGEICLLKDKYREKKLHGYLDQMKKSILEHDHIFIAQGSIYNDPFWEYRVNLILDNTDRPQTPVITEISPTLTNLFGTITKVPVSGGFIEGNFNSIKPGSILAADGGFLILDAHDVLAEPGVWKRLKQFLKYGKLNIQNINNNIETVSDTIRPEPIDINTKVIVIGESGLFFHMYGHDSQFKDIFKVKVELVPETDLSDGTLLEYARFIKKICSESGLKDFDRDAVRVLIEESVRLGGRHGKLSAQFGAIADLIRESDYWARMDKANYVLKEHVIKAVEEKRARVTLIEDKIRDMMERDTILIATEGERTGQANALSIVSLGYHTFGRPARVTASIGMGKVGIINIEREAKLSGKSHDKGVLIISGYLRSRYSQRKPLSLTASICFEQSYTGIDGDSASAAEIITLLSALAGKPLKQGIAVTGSVSQYGEVQAVGGINYKIEGFFDLCKKRGLTGQQGVIIPKSNISDLQLREEVVKTVEDKLFHIWAISNVDDGLEILTGIEAGTEDSKGDFPEGSLNDMINKRLIFLAQDIKNYK